MPTGSYTEVRGSQEAPFVGQSHKLTISPRDANTVNHGIHGNSENLKIIIAIRHTINFCRYCVDQLLDKLGMNAKYAIAIYDLVIQLVHSSILLMYPYSFEM